MPVIETDWLDGPGRRRLRGASAGRPVSRLGHRGRGGVSLRIVEVFPQIDLPHHALANAFRLGMRPAIDASLAMADLALEPEGVEHTSLVDLDAAPRLFEMGFAAMQARLGDLLALLS